MVCQRVYASILFSPTLCSETEQLSLHKAMTFRGSIAARNLSLVHLFLGVFMLVFAIVDVAEVKWWTSKVAFGVWTGCLVFLTGASGLVSSRVHSSAWCAMFTALCGLSSLTSLAVVVAYSLALEEVSREWRFNSYKHISTPSTVAVSLSAGSPTKLAITSTILVLGAAEFVVSVWSLGSYCVSDCFKEKSKHGYKGFSPIRSPPQQKEVFYMPPEIQVVPATQPSQPVNTAETKPQKKEARVHSPRRQSENGSLGHSTPMAKPNQSPGRSYTREHYRSPGQTQGVPQGKQYNHPKAYSSHGTLQGAFYGRQDPADKTYI